MPVSQEYADKLESENEELRRRLKRKALRAALQDRGVQLEGKRLEVVESELMDRLTLQDGDVLAKDEEGDFIDTADGLAGPSALVDEITDSEEWEGVLDETAGESDEERKERRAQELSGGTTSTDPDKAERAKELNRQSGKPWR